MVQVHCSVASTGIRSLVSWHSVDRISQLYYPLDYDAPLFLEKLTVIQLNLPCTLLVIASQTYSLLFI